MNSILFDIGATKTRMAFAENTESFEEPVIYETPKSYAEILNKFIETAKELSQGREIKKVCGGASRSVEGFLNYEQFKNDLQKEFGPEVMIENDAAMAGLGEANFGAGQGEEIMAYITVSTGVGGARIVNGKLDEKWIGFEPGRQIMETQTGETLEDMISGKALEKREGKHPKDISDPLIWEDLARKLAAGLNNIIVEWSPSCIVLGGSMITGEPSIPLDKTESYLKEILKIFPVLPKIKKAELGDFGGIFGALACLKEETSEAAV